MVNPLPLRARAIRQVERLLQLRKAQGVAKFSRRGRWQALWWGGGVVGRGGERWGGWGGWGKWGRAIHDFLLDFVDANKDVGDSVFSQTMMGPPNAYFLKSTGNRWIFPSKLPCAIDFDNSETCGVVGPGPGPVTTFRGNPKGGCFDIWNFRGTQENPHPQHRPFFIASGAARVRELLAQAQTSALARACAWTVSCLEHVQRMRKVPCKVWEGRFPENAWKHH